MSQTDASQAVATAPLSAVFDENAQMRGPITGFLTEIIAENPETFWGLFENFRNAAEMETIVHQTIRGMLRTGKPYNGLSLAPDSGGGLVCNSGALSTLERNGYVLVNAGRDKITLTDKMLGALLSYSGKAAGSTSLLHAPASERLQLK